MSISVSVEPLSCSAKLTITTTEPFNDAFWCAIFKNGVRRGSWAYYFILDFSDSPLTATLPLFPLSPATNYTLKCSVVGYEFEVSFRTHDIPTAGAYSVNGTLTDVEKELNARYINRIMSNNDDWSLNAICVMIGLLDSYGGLNPLYMWEQSQTDFRDSFFGGICRLKYPWNAPYLQYNENRQPWLRFLNESGMSWYSWLEGTVLSDESTIRKTTFAGLPLGKAAFWSTMFQLKDLGLYDYDWYYDDKAMSIENIALILKYIYRFPGTSTGGKVEIWGAPYSFKISTKDTDELVDIAYNRGLNLVGDFYPFRDIAGIYSGDRVTFYTRYYRDTVDIDLWKDRAKYWYNKLKPKPPHKKHKMPIWEYLRYTI